MATTYQSWSVVFGEQPSAAKWNILGTNDAGFNSGTALPIGSCVQVAQNTISAVATGTTIIPADDTIPQITEGDQYMTQAITPRSATNLLVIEASILMSNNQANSNNAVALFQDSTANALAGSIGAIASANFMTTLSLRYGMVAGTTSSTTFRVRAGGSLAGTTTVNGQVAGRFYGAMPKSSLIVREYTV
jgi:hypothetical protein